MVVPIIFETCTIKDDAPLFSWIFYMFISKMNHHCMAIIGQENFFKNLDNKRNNYIDLGNRIDFSFPNNRSILEYQKYMITNDELNRVIKDYSNSYESEKALITDFNSELYTIIAKRIQSIESDFNQKVSTIIVWVNNATINQYASEHNIHVINMELSTIRKMDYQINLMYFCPDKYSTDYCQSMYHEYLKCKDIPVLSRRQILSLFIATNYLNKAFHYDSFAPYELGVSPGLKKDFFFDLYSNEPIQITLKKAKKMFPESSVSIRFHPGFHWDLSNYNFHIDHSINSIEWILKCKRIVTSVSNVGFEAMLLGKNVYVLSDYMPYSFMVLNHLDYVEDSSTDIRFLNFMIFVFFVPLSLATDVGYIEWRHTNPPINEIYKKHIQTIKKELKITGDFSLENILKSVHHMSLKEISALVQDNDFVRYQNLQNRYKSLEEKILILQKTNQNLNHELDNILNSKSWKVTKPLRFVSKKIQKKN